MDPNKLQPMKGLRVETDMDDCEKLRCTKQHSPRYHGGTEGSFSAAPRPMEPATAACGPSSSAATSSGSSSGFPWHHFIEDGMLQTPAGSSAHSQRPSLSAEVSVRSRAGASEQWPRLPGTGQIGRRATTTSPSSRQLPLPVPDSRRLSAVDSIMQPPFPQWSHGWCRPSDLTAHAGSQYLPSHSDVPGENPSDEATTPEDQDAAQILSSLSSSGGPAQTRLPSFSDVVGAYHSSYRTYPPTPSFDARFYYSRQPSTNIANARATPSAIAPETAATSQAMPFAPMMAGALQTSPMSTMESQTRHRSRKRRRSDTLPAEDYETHVGSSYAHPDQPAAKAARVELNVPKKAAQVCQACTETCSETNTRTIISHYFGRNKGVTKSMPSSMMPMQCRKSYQREKYRANGRSEVTQWHANLILSVVNKVDDWWTNVMQQGQLRWTIQMNKCVNDAPYQWPTDALVQRILNERGLLGGNLSTQKVKRAVTELWQSIIPDVTGRQMDLSKLSSERSKAHEVYLKHPDLGKIEFLPGSIQEGKDKGLRWDGVTGAPL